jgi:hypothetical protein
MPTVEVIIGTAAIPLFMPNRTGEVADILLVNVSAADIYLGSDAMVRTTNGIPFLIGAVYHNKQEIEPLWAISASAGRAVRIRIVRYLNMNIVRIEE